MSIFYELANFYDRLVASGKDVTPLYSTIIKTGLEVRLSKDSNFIHGAFVNNQPDSVIAVPVTIKSECRTSGIAPHPIFDNLDYIAADIKIINPKANENKHPAYMEQLEAWAQHPAAHPAVHIIYDYLKKGTLVQDLISHNVFPYDKKGNMSLILPGGSKKTQVKVYETCVRFVIDWQDDNFKEKIWEMPEFFTSWKAFIKEQQKKEKHKMQLCHVTGKVMYCSEMQPIHARNVYDRAHFTSMNDTSGATFRCRDFKTPDDCATIGLETGYKIVHACAWLVKHCGYDLGSGSYLIGLQSNGEAVNLQLGSTAYDIVNNDVTDKANWLTLEKSIPECRNQIYSALLKANPNIAEMQDVTLLLLFGDLQGRMNIRDGMNMTLSDVSNSIAVWHSIANAYCYDYNKRKYVLNGVSVPALARYLYGSSVEKGNIIISDKIKHKVQEHIIMMMLGLTSYTPDISARITYNVLQYRKSLSTWRWRRLVHAAVCMIYMTKYTNEEEYTLALDKNNTNRSYLFGRLFAVLERVEMLGRSTEAKKKGKTSTQSTMDTKLYNFQQMPADIVQAVFPKVRFWLSRCNVSTQAYFRKLYAEILAIMPDGAFNNDYLEEDWLLGYAHQTHAFFNNADVTGNEAELLTQAMSEDAENTEKDANSEDTDSEGDDATDNQITLFA